jgi:DnaJ-class molecular chaperone
MGYEARTCGACNGAKGRMVTTQDGKTTRSSWQNCGACGGKGVR